MRERCERLGRLLIYHYGFARDWVSPEIVEGSLCCLRSDGSDLLVFDRRQQSGGAVPSSSVVEVVTPHHDDFASVGLRGEMMPGQPLVFEGGEERLRGGVIEARPDSAHRLPHPEPTTQIRESCCGVGG